MKIPLLNYTLSRVLAPMVVASILAASVDAATIVTENMGTPSGTTSIAANAFQNSGTLTYAGTGDVRTSTASSGYGGASGSGNVFLTQGGTVSFTISGINTSSFDTIGLSFGAFKSTTASDLTDLVVSYSTDGTTFTPLTVPAQPTGGGTAVWRLITVSGAIPSSSTLSLRFVNTSTTNQARVDDVLLTGNPVPEPSTFVTLLGGLGMLCGFRRIRSRRLVSRN
jgi:hypothetical protein